MLHHAAAAGAMRFRLTNTTTPCDVEDPIDTAAGDIASVNNKQLAHGGAGKKPLSFSREGGGGRGEDATDAASEGTVATPPSAEVGRRLTREEKRRRRRATDKYRMAHATRERFRVEAFNVAFSELRKLLPTLPPDKKLSKIEILRLAICYISYLNHVLEMG